ncbi:MAG: hypothetical protein ACTSYL_10495 [Candidatus Thorarchaeota archaeon]
MGFDRDKCYNSGTYFNLLEEEIRIPTKRMPEVDNSLLKLFEKLANWLNLSENAAPALAALLYEKYKTGQRLSAKEISERTGYSRASVGTIMAELVMTGIVTGHRDNDQTGRGRRRILYGIDGDVSMLFLAGVDRMLQRLQVIKHDIVQLHDEVKDEKALGSMLKDLHVKIDDSIHCLSNLDMFKTA